MKKGDTIIYTDPDNGEEMEGEIMAMHPSKDNADVQIGDETYLLDLDTLSTPPENSQDGTSDAQDPPATDGEGIEVVKLQAPSWMGKVGLSDGSQLAPDKEGMIECESSQTAVLINMGCERI